MYPLVATAAASVVLIGAHGDFLLADLLYTAQGNAWALRDSWITTTLVHEAGKAVSAAAWLGALIASLWSLVDPRLSHWRRPLGYLAFATLAGSVAVSLLKAGSGMDCPWDLQRYGGLQPFVGLFESRPHSMGHASCFPAGHASAGYAWVTLYFFFRAVQPRLRWAGLALALAAGALFGISQQLRGAHFLSHDVWTLMICWLVALGGSLWILRPYGSGMPA
ncbi:phosphatase PAP2 family protein [Lysobacter sp. A03]|uniref:phosphatase PAP2 family protein n=1 Tax=Lysobacter sp. A03 TaxID=1199154 RepID=UPI0005B714F0|nr:phosphatase PAP2 family protein [Lysobacter sp. A03]KIQ96535.1 hypothetical protein TI01_1984 [Lysobacter sp. A03]